ncbi:DUF317 domain-containing protein [Streptomyces sp. NBC_00237]|uniref:DUF317 domain-containing protein n=1 Tax=Streptomyces sp. NBC_00237 TaxID=2975687 RepID=UPI00338FEE9A
MRVELVHEPDAREPAWTIAAYETPVSDRTWHLTLTRDTPGPLLRTLLTSLTDADALEPTVGEHATGLAVIEAARPLLDAGWTSTPSPNSIAWTTPQNDAGIHVGTTGGPNPSAGMTRWTLWSGHSTDHPTWVVRASTATPAALLANLAEELATGTGTRLTGPQPATKHRAQPTPTPAPPPARPHAADLTQTARHQRAPARCRGTQGTDCPTHPPSPLVALTLRMPSSNSTARQWC